VGNLGFNLRGAEGAWVDGAEVGVLGGGGGRGRSVANAAALASAAVRHATATEIGEEGGVSSFCLDKVGYAVSTTNGAGRGAADKWDVRCGGGGGCLEDVLGVYFGKTLFCLTG